MSVRRSLIGLVLMTVLLLAVSVSYSIQQKKVVTLTENLISSYSALMAWSEEINRPNPDETELNTQASIIKLHLPKFIGEEQATVQLAHLLTVTRAQDIDLEKIQHLHAVLITELFECHRMQNRYSQILANLLIALLLVIISIGTLSYLMGRRAQDYRLAPFPEANPNPIFGFNYKGHLIYKNAAAKSVLKSLLPQNPNVAKFFPEDYLERIKKLRRFNKRLDTWTSKIKDTIFQHKVHLFPLSDRIHIYSEDITEQETIRSEIEYIAFHDLVSALANRQRLENVLSEQLADKAPLTLVLTHLSGLNKLISTQGVAIGDKVTKVCTERLSSTYMAIGQPEIKPLIFRIDGSLFGCLYFEHISKESLIELTDMLGQLSEAAIKIEQNEYLIWHQSAATLSRDESSPIQLIQKTTIALHSISDSDKTFQRYDEAVEAKIQRRDLLERSLRKAIDNHELRMVYQPQQDLNSGVLIGFEALMRWDFQGNAVSPIEFIPLAEKSGLIHQLGHWSLVEVLQQVSKWQSQGLTEFGVIAVNVSAQEFSRSDFIDKVNRVVNEYNCKPQMIQLELTESSILLDEDAAIERMYQLKDIGFSLAIDDFGTGYSSFSYLSRFPVDKLKIDRSFVINMANGARDIAVVAAMIEVAHQLKIKVIAEGVETEQQKQQLITLGCDQIQGYLFGKPLESSQAEMFTKKCLGVL